MSLRKIKSRSEGANDRRPGTWIGWQVPEHAPAHALAHALALGLYVVLAFIFTYPLLLNLDRVNGGGDPAVMVWSMAWIAHALVTDPASLYDANIFYPIESALSYTDLLLPSALLAAPFYYLTGNPLLGNNVVLFLTFVLSGYTVFLLVRHLLEDRSYALTAALFAGAVYTLSPYRMGHITQLNSMTTYWLPLILLFMHRYLERGRNKRDLWLTGLFFALNALSGLYYGIFALLMVLIFLGAWFVLRRELPGLGDFIRAVPAAAVFGGALIVLLYPYISQSGDAEHSRGMEQVSGGSFVPQALLVSPPESMFLGWTPEAFGITHAAGKPVYELTLYPGIAAALLAAYGLYRTARHIPRHTALYAALGLGMAVLSCGPLLQLGSLNLPLPYILLYELPGFGNLRVPARMWAIVMLCIAVLAGFGLRALLERLSGRGRFGGRKAALALAGISVFAAVEFLPTLPVDRYIDRGPATLEPAYQHLVENDPETVIAEVPFATGEEAFRETPRMYRSAYGWWELVNGYASYFPDGYEETRAALDTFPEEESLRQMREVGAEYMVLHPQQFDDDGEDGAARVAAADANPDLERLAGDEEAVLYRLR